MPVCYQIGHLTEKSRRIFFVTTKYMNGSMPQQSYKVITQASCMTLFRFCVTSGLIGNISWKVVEERRRWPVLSSVLLQIVVGCRGDGIQRSFSMRLAVIPPPMK